MSVPQMADTLSAKALKGSSSKNTKSIFFLTAGLSAAP